MKLNRALVFNIFVACFLQLSWGVASAHPCFDVAIAQILQSTHDHALTRFQSNTNLSAALREEFLAATYAKRYRGIAANPTLLSTLEATLARIVRRRPARDAIAEKIYFFHAAREVDSILQRSRTDSAGAISDLESVSVGAVTPDYVPVDDLNLNPDPDGWVRLGWDDGIVTTGRFRIFFVNREYFLVVGQTALGDEIEAAHVGPIPTRIAVEPVAALDGSGIDRVRAVFSGAPTIQQHFDQRPYPRAFVTEAGTPMQMLVTQDQDWALRNGRIFRNISPDQLPKGYAYTYVFLANGDVIYGQVRDEWEFNVSHRVLAGNEPVLIGGEMQVPESGTISFNHLSGTYSRFIMRRRVVEEATIVDRLHRAFAALGATELNYVGHRSLLPKNFPGESELRLVVGSPEFALNLGSIRSQCRSQTFAAANPRLCRAVAAADL